MSAPPASLPASAGRVQRALAGLGSAARVRETPASTRTAAEAAAACGCAEGAIVKSLVFRGAESGRGILVQAARLTASIATCFSRSNS